MNISEYIKENQKTHIIFDFDRTLFHLHLDWDRYFDDIRSQLLDWDESILLDYENESISWSEMQNKYVKDFGDSAKKLLYKNNSRNEMKLFLGVSENKELTKLIHALPEYNLYIWSSNTTELIRNILQKFDLENKFTKIITRNDVAFLKPHPEGFLKIKNASQDRSKYILIGDSIADKKAAQAANIEFLKVNYFLDENSSSKY